MQLGSVCAATPVADKQDKMFWHGLQEAGANHGCYLGSRGGNGSPPQGVHEQTPLAAPFTSKAPWSRAV